MIKQLKDFDACYILCFDKRWNTYGISLVREMKRRFNINAIPFICGDGQTLLPEQYRSIDVTTGPTIYTNNYSCMNNVLSCKRSEERRVGKECRL